MTGTVGKLWEETRGREVFKRHPFANRTRGHVGSEIELHLGLGSFWREEGCKVLVGFWEKLKAVEVVAAISVLKLNRETWIRGG